MQKIKGLEELTYREEQVFYRLAAGLKKEAIAKILGLKAATVNGYKSVVYSKLGIHNQCELIIFYYKKLMEEKE